MKKVLVTGASGFIGRHCLPLLKKRGYEVYAISSKAPPAIAEGIHWVQFDLLGSDSIAELLETIKPSHLLHFAWNVIPGRFWMSRDNLAWLKSGIDLVEAFAIQGGKRAVLSGTCAEYDWNALQFEENVTSCAPQTLYGSSKLALQLVLESLAREWGFSQAWGRIFYLYGPHEYPQRFVSSVIKGLLQKKPVPCSHGNQVRDFLHVQDVADAFVTLLDSDVQGIVNIGSGTGVTLKQVVGQIAEELGEQDLVKWGALAAPPNDPASLIATTNRLNTEVRWRPRFSLEEGIKDAISWWKVHDSRL